MKRQKCNHRGHRGVNNMFGTITSPISREDAKALRKDKHSALLLFFACFAALRETDW